MITLQYLQDYIQSEYGKDYIQRDEGNVYFLNFEMKILDENLGFITICDKKLKVKLPELELQSLGGSDLDLSEEIDFRLYYQLTKENIGDYNRHLIELIKAYDKRDYDDRNGYYVCWRNDRGTVFKLDRYNTLKVRKYDLEYEGDMKMYYDHIESGLVVKIDGWWDSYNGASMNAKDARIGHFVEETIVVENFKVLR